MLLNNVACTLIEVRHVEGVSKKTGNPYSIYSLMLGDAEYNKLNANIGKGLLVEGVIPEWVFKAADKKAEVVCEIRIVPDGFGAKLVVEDIQSA